MLPEIGKVDKATFDRVIFPNLGKADRSVLIGPRHGVDAAVVELPGGKVMVVAEDPTFGMPALMPYFGWAIVHICASDIAVLGVPPRYMPICLMLPPGTEDKVLEDIWMDTHRECEKLGIAVIGGHTGVYPGIGYPLNGGCTMFGIGSKEQLTPPSNAKVGDRVIITKGPAIESTGILALQAEKPLTDKFGKDLIEKAKKHIVAMTVVQDALVAAPNAHAMHDATEGGLLNGIYEVVEASGTGVTIYEEKIIVPEEIEAVHRYFNIDPLISISEGTLVATATPENTPKIINDLKQSNIAAWEIGEVTEKDRVFVRKNGKKEALTPVKVDPFWAAYFSTLGG